MSVLCPLLLVEASKRLKMFLHFVLGAGADKVSINSEAIKRPSLSKEIATIFGSQYVVCSMDIKKIDGKYKVFNKKEGLLDIDPITLAKEYESQGAGRFYLLLLTKRVQLWGMT